MQTEDLLKVKFVLVCALASEVESGRHIGIPLEQLMEAIGITALPCPATAGSVLLCNGRKSPPQPYKSTPPLGGVFVYLLFEEGLDGRGSEWSPRGAPEPSIHGLRPSSLKKPHRGLFRALDPNQATARIKSFRRGLAGW